MTLFTNKRHGLLLILSLALVFTTVMTFTAIARADNSGIPPGCSGNPNPGVENPKDCPKLKDAKVDLNCGSDQTPTKADNGKWYCKDNGGAADDSGIPLGCPGNPNSGPKDPDADCPKLKDSKSDLSCGSDQTPTKASNGKWYCKDNASAPGGGGKATPGGATTVDHAGCTGSTCGHQCGASDQNPYTPGINIGCRGKGNPILDSLFGIIRFLSNGVGLIVVGSIVVGGIQYSGSRGDPQSTAMAINRIRSSLFALLLYVFAYAILNFIIPEGVLR